MFGLNITPTNPYGNPSPEMLRALGVESVRYTYNDHTPGPAPMSERLNFYVQTLGALADAGITSWLILGSETAPNAPRLNDSDYEWDQYISAFIIRIRQVAARLAPWEPAYQIWNEPDLTHNRSAVRTEVYARLLRRAYEAIKSVAPTSLVTTAGLASGNPGWLTEVIGRQGGNLSSDIVAFHPYGQRPEPDWPYSAWGFGYVGNLIKAYKQASPRPLWISEIGIETLTPPNQAEYLRRFYQTVVEKYRSDIDRVYWFCYSDGMVNGFGLVDRDGHSKPACEAYRQTATRFSNQNNDRPAYAVRFLQHNTPAQAIAGSTISVQLTLQNSSSKIWQSTGDHRVRLGYHWYTNTGRELQPDTWTDIRTPLPRDIQPGQELTLDAQLSIPREAGLYQMRWDLVEEGVTWFSWKEAQTLDVALTVRPQNDPPPASLVIRASHNSIAEGTDNLRQAVDGRSDTRWSTRTYQRPGMWFELDLGQPRTIEGLTVDTTASPNDYPRGYIIQSSPDGHHWSEAACNRFNRDALISLQFRPFVARYLRIEQTGRAEQWWWSIHEVRLKLGQTAATLSPSMLPRRLE